MTVIDPQRLRERSESQAPRMADQADQAAACAVLGAALTHAECILDAGHLARDDWADPRHALIWGAILKAKAEREIVDPITVADVLKDRLKDAGDIGYLLDLQQMLTTADTDPGIVKAHADTVRKNATNRRAHDALLDGARRMAGGADLDDVRPQLRAVLEPRETTQQIALLTIDDMVQAPPVSWLVSRLLPRGGKVVFGGEPAAGKTLLVLDVALRMSTGQDWLGRRCKAASTVYLAGEGVGGLGARIRAWKAAHPAARPVDGHYFAMHDGIPDLLAPDAVARLSAIIEAAERAHGRRPDVLVIDTLAMATPGSDGNDAGPIGTAMAVVTEIQRRYGCAIVILHHTRKPSQERGDRGGGKRTQHDLRGSSALAGAVDVVLLATGDANSGRQLQTVKSRDGELLPPIPYVIHGQDTGSTDEDGAAEFGPVVLPAPAEPVAAPASDGMQKILAAVRQLNGTPTTRDTVVTTARVNLVVGRALLDQAIAEGRVATRPAPGRRTIFTVVSDVQGFAVPPTVPPKGGDGGTATAADKPYAVRDGGDGEGRRDGEEVSRGQFQEPTVTTAAPEPPAPTRVVQSEDHGRPEKPSGGRRRREGAA